MEQELAINLEHDRIHYLTQVEIAITTADFYFPLEPRPLIVFVDGQVHLKTSQMIKDEELRTLLRKRGYRILELSYKSYSENKRDQLYQEILANLGTDYLDQCAIRDRGDLSKSTAIGKT
jgi:very-short-patch-repair endonuclease